MGVEVNVDHKLFADATLLLTVVAVVAFKLVVSQSMIIKSKAEVVLLINALKQTKGFVTAFSVVFALDLEIKPIDY